MYSVFRFSIIILQLYIGVSPVFSQINGRETIKLGAYYFDGWTGKTFHINKRLTTEFTERAPVNGWVTSTQQGMQKQISQASEAGLSFFNFCWYYNHNIDSLTTNIRNNALKLYLGVKNKKGLKFSIMVANHDGYVIRSEHWDKLTTYWCTLFLSPSYLTSNGGPIITFFSVHSLLTTFGTPEKVSAALDLFRKKAYEKGFNNVSFAVCTGNNRNAISLSEKCGFNIITSYNNHDFGLNLSQQDVVPIETMVRGDVETWNNIKNMTRLPQIPTITLNWDRRPWDEIRNKTSKRFYGYSKESIIAAIFACRDWVSYNRNSILSERIVNVFAWNEYGEGGWLTPSLILKNSLLEGVKHGLNK